MSADDIKLLPCPFCDGAAALGAIGRDWWRLTADHDENCVLVEHEVAVPQTDEQRQYLIDAWNRRAAPSPQGDAGWMLIEEDAPIDVPMDTSVLLAWWDDWSEEWKIEANYAGSERGGWRHGRATHWMPLPAPPAARSTPATEKGE